MQTSKIIMLKKGTPKALKEVNHLLSQLSITAIRPLPLTSSQFSTILAQKNLFFLAAMSSAGARGTIIGFLIIYLVRLPSGLIAMAEDLIVDEPYRKWGIGRILVEQGINFAEEKGARHLSLRTNPKRIEANKLYPQVGMHLMIGNFYRINLPRK